MAAETDVASNVCRRCDMACAGVNEFNPFCLHCADWMMMATTDGNGHVYDFDDNPTIGERLRFGFNALHGDAEE